MLKLSGSNLTSQAVVRGPGGLDHFLDTAQLAKVSQARSWFCGFWTKAHLFTASTQALANWRKHPFPGRASPNSSAT